MYALVPPMSLVETPADGRDTNNLIQMQTAGPQPVLATIVHPYDRGLVV